jgi:dipeptidase E
MVDDLSYTYANAVRIIMSDTEVLFLIPRCPMRRLLLFSTSTVHGTGYMEYALPALDAFLGAEREILFIPWARPGGVSHERYTEAFSDALKGIGGEVRGLHEAEDPVAAIAAAKSVYTGGGNTFVLLRAMYESGIVRELRRRVLEGMPYMGSSAGANVAGRSIGTTNDMPIVYPPSFDALGLVPFNINPHYLDADPSSRHMGETRETRIREFHVFNRQAVVGLREGAWVEIDGETATLHGETGGVLFTRGAEASELMPRHDLSALMDQVEA